MLLPQVCPYLNLDRSATIHQFLSYTFFGGPMVALANRPLSRILLIYVGALMLLMLTACESKPVKETPAENKDVGHSVSETKKETPKKEDVKSAQQPTKKKGSKTM